MFNNKQFRELIAKPVLVDLRLWSQEAEDLMIGTLAQESMGGTYIAQDPGPALGVFQMEPRTHDELWKVLIPSNPFLSRGIMMSCGMSTKPDSKMLVYNLRYATAMARVFYFQFRKTLPDGTKVEEIPKDLENQAKLYKLRYNTPLGKATVEEYISRYHLFNGIKGDSSEKGKQKGKG